MARSRSSRKAFGIGAPDWNDVVDDNVRVRFHLVESNRALVERARHAGSCREPAWQTIRKLNG